MLYPVAPATACQVKVGIDVTVELFAGLIKVGASIAYTGKATPKIPNTIILLIVLNIL